MTKLIENTNYYKCWYDHSLLSSSTKQGYTSQFRKFDEFLLKKGFEGELDFDHFYYYKNGDSNPIDVKVIDQFVDYLVEHYVEAKGQSYNSVYSSISALTSFFGFLKEFDLIENNPLQGYPNPFYRRVIKDRALSKSECDRLLEAAYMMGTSSMQYYLLMLLLLTSGLRAKEICSLEIDQINFELNTIIVNKGQKTTAGTIPLKEHVAEAFKYYFSTQEWLDWNNKGNTTVFFEGSTPLSYGKLRRVIDRISTAAGFWKSITPHQFRHTTAQMLYKSGLELYSIKKILRHRLINTTLIYLGPVLTWDDIEKYIKQ